MANLIQDKILYTSQTCLEETFRERYVHRIIRTVRHELAEEGDRDWLVDTSTGASVKLSEVEPTTRRVASGLTRRGFGHGDVLQTGLTSVLGAWGALGAWMCGGRVSVADPGLELSMIRSQVEDTGAKVLVCSLEHAEKYASLVEQMKEEGCKTLPLLFVLDADENDDLPAGAECFNLLLDDDGLDAPIADMLPAYDPQEPVTIFWTSGSTGTPKGVVHSQQNVHLSTFNADSEEKRLLMTSVFFHVSGFNIVTIMGLIGSKTVYFIPFGRCTPESCLELIEKYDAQHLVIGVFHYISLSNLPQDANRQFRSLTKVTPCGGAVSPGITAKVLSLLGKGGRCLNMECYGSTECWLVSTITSDNIGVGELGQLRPGVQVYIQDPETKERLGPGECGKIMVRTRTMMLGYLNRPEATKEFFDAEGYGYIGDVGYYDEQGNLFFSHRMKDGMKVNGSWIGPGEIENVLESEDSIEEAGVWGRYDLNQGTDLINLAIVFKKGAKAWHEDEIRELVASRLPESRRITGSIYYLDSLPHNAVGKKLRMNLPEYCLTHFKMEDLIKYALHQDDQKTQL